MLALFCVSAWLFNPIASRAWAKPVDERHEGHQQATGQDPDKGGQGQLHGGSKELGQGESGTPVMRLLQQMMGKGQTMEQYAATDQKHGNCAQYSE